VATALETAVVLVVEPRGGPLTAIKAQFNAPSIASGMPVHLTLLYPFVAPEELDQEAVARLADVARDHAPLAFTLSNISTFPGGFVCLDPEPAEPVRALQRAIWAAFPERPPYAGDVTDPHPHVTVGKAVPDETVGELVATISERVQPLVPVSCAVEKLTVAIRDDAGAWTLAHQLTLGAGAAL
jgi:2'-5' RNA ligase